ncbi:M23 family metallopeptidase [Shewanella piezotolerans]|nr:M23 family metallopeptidase [Shewanella piezotolerans]
MQLQTLSFSGKTQLAELGLSLLLLAGLFYWLYIIQPQPIDWSNAPTLQQDWNITTKIEQPSGIQQLYIENFTPYPQTFTYRLLDDYSQLLTEKAYLPSPVMVPANTKVHAADYIAIKNREQKGIGFTFLNHTYAHNTNNIQQKRYVSPIKKEALVLQAPNKEHFKPWMLKLNSHQGINVNAIDFDVPIGTPIYAMAAGEVVSAYEDSDFGCPTEECVPYGNELEILHEDGSVAVYAHLKQNGINVSLGDKVTAGQLVAYSGDTGGGGAPHLHVQIDALKYSDSSDTTVTSLPLIFIGENRTVIELSEGDYINATSMTATMMNRFNRAYYH